MKVELNFAILNEEGDFRAEIVDSDSPEEIRKGYLSGSNDSLACMYKVFVEDEKKSIGGDYLQATAYEATQNIDRLSDIPHMHDLMMLLCTEAFKAGLDYYEAKYGKPTIVQ